MLICACEFMFWFAPVATATSAVAVTQQDRAGAMAFYEGSLQVIKKKLELFFCFWVVFAKKKNLVGVI
jgi:hypothetical protein